MTAASETSTACVACGHTDHTFVTEARPGLDMMRCNYCGLVFVSPLWTDKVAADVFAQHGNWPEGIIGGATNREPGFRFVARQIVSRLPDGGRLLDVGCASGIFFDAIRSETADGRGTRGWQFYGAEPDPRWQDFGYGEAKVEPRPLRLCGFSDAFFDVVTLLDVLYYIPEPDAELAEVSRILKPGGLLVFDTASQLYFRLRGLAGGILGLDRTHTFAAYPFYFSQRSLRILLQRAGLQVVDVLGDRGAVQPETTLRLLISIYVALVRGMVHLSSACFALFPKLIYLARRSEN